MAAGEPVIRDVERIEAQAQQLMNAPDKRGELRLDPSFEPPAEVAGGRTSICSPAAMRSIAIHATSWPARYMRTAAMFIRSARASARPTAKPRP